MLRMIIIFATKCRKNENFVNKQLNSDFPTPPWQESKLNPLFHPPLPRFPFKCSSSRPHNKALNVYSRFHLMAIQIAVPFIKRTIKSSFAICDTL